VNRAAEEADSVRYKTYRIYEKGARSVKRIAVTGASGFIGRHVVEALAARGDHAIPVARPYVLEHLARTFEGIDAVVHLAGVVSAVHERDFYAANVDAARVVADAAASAGARLVHISSLAAAGRHRRMRLVAKTIRRNRLRLMGSANLKVNARSLRSLACDGQFSDPASSTAPGTARSGHYFATPTRGAAAGWERPRRLYIRFRYGCRPSDSRRGRSRC
jgi:NAD(P)-dependent dehydrogenase (short-subunit alcohol dehydrogenase family)